jgi:hypothetical protein
MRVPARNQRQVYTGYVNKQGHGDTEEPHPKPPIAVGAFPIGTMNMRFMMVIVHDLIHSYPAFLYNYATEPTDRSRLRPVAELRAGLNDQLAASKALRQDPSSSRDINSAH